MYTVAEFMRCHAAARFISAIRVGTRKYPEFRKKYHIFLQGRLHIKSTAEAPTRFLFVKNDT